MVEVRKGGGAGGGGWGGGWGVRAEVGGGEERWRGGWRWVEVVRVDVGGAGGRVGVEVWVEVLGRWVERLWRQLVSVSQG